MKKVIALCLLAAVTSCTAGDKVNILCLGDSITQGGKRDREEYTYRWPLFCMLVDAGVKFDFIGSLDKGLHEEARWPAEYKGVPFDPDHEGVYGIKTARALERLPEAIKKWDAAPDIALIHLGTNDKGTGTNKEPLRKIIELLREQNPEMVIILGHLNFNDSPGAFRIDAEISELKKEMSTDQSPILIAHHYQNWQENPKAPDADTFDWAHPNPQGQRKMAERWFEAMKPWLKTDS